MTDKTSGLSNSFRWNAKHYDPQYNKFVEDIAFWIEKANKYGGCVLELACGSGRVAIPMAAKGISVTGIDIDADMLESAREKAAAENLKIELVCGDCRNFSLKRKFPLIIMPFNAFNFICFSVEDIRSFFETVKDHLTDDGCLILDLINPPFNILANYPNGRAPIPIYHDPDGNGLIDVVENDIRYETDTQIWRSVWHYSIERREIKTEEFFIRLFFPREIDALLDFNGFSIEEKLSDYSGEKFKKDSYKQIIICKRKKISAVSADRMMN